MFELIELIFNAAIIIYLFYPIASIISPGHLVMEPIISPMTKPQRIIA